MVTVKLLVRLLFVTSILVLSFHDNFVFGFLRFYNLQDVQPLAHAIKNCFEAYFKYFGVNAITAMSLPSLAQEAMFKNFEPNSKYGF